MQTTDNPFTASPATLTTGSPQQKATTSSSNRQETSTTPSPEATTQPQPGAEQAQRSRSDQDTFHTLMRNASYSPDTAGDDYPRLLTAWTTARAHTPPRGLAITGPFGCGKTHAARALWPRAKILHCALTNAIERLASTAFYETDDWLRDLILDDLGAENLHNDYGIIRDPIANLIIRRHHHAELHALHPDRFIPPGTLTITTNLPFGTGQGTLAHRLGGRAASRLRQMCTPIEMKGKDKRR